MGTSAAETLKEIEGIKGRLEADVRELQDRLPAPAVWAKRAVGVALGGGLAGGALMFLRRRMRGGKKREAGPAQAVVKIVPESGAVVASEDSPRSRWMPLMAAMGAAMIVLRVIELRELRRIRGGPEA